MNGSPWDHVNDALREALALRMRPSEVYRKLMAGTLEGIERPTPMPERTFYRRWGRLKKEQERARTGGSVLEMLGREMVARDIIKAGLTEGWGDAAIIRAVTSETTLPAAQAKMLLKLSKGAPAEEQLALLNGARGLTDE